MLTQLAKGKTIEQAEKLTMKDVKDKLDDLPKIKIHCSTMAIQALKKAIEDYKKNKKNKPSLEKIKN
jgi:nitrogen fixation protein NifU and related proteins